MRLNILFQSQNYSKDLRKEYQHSLLEYDIKNVAHYLASLRRGGTALSQSYSPGARSFAQSG